MDRLFLHRRGELTWDQMTNFHGGPRRQGHRLIFWSFMAVLIDALILLSMSCFFLLAFSLIVRSPLGEILRGSGRWLSPRSFIAVFVACAWMYTVSLRVFFGFTLGEWACDLRLGQPTERLRRAYPLKVALRMSLIVGTGLILLPLLSILFGRDLAGRLSGLRMISLK
ncbi:MAG: RDD family protein [Bdellovibrionaceae bacterium]|nr:RDD family protein [Pseudobdellovibrionaceae bacterium]